MNPEPANPAGHGPGALGRWLLVAAVAAAAFWLWVCWCVFPLSVWNDVRLAPTLALARGIDFYPPQDMGAVTTWIYGPLPVFLWMPAALAGTAAHALMIAGGLNIGLTTAALAATFALWPERVDRAHRLATGVLAIAIWPFAAFQYLQADNVAIALGLLGNLVLVRAGRQVSGGGRARGSLWLAALLGAGAVFCKQTSVGIGLAQVLWLGIVLGPRAAFAHAVRGLAAGMALALALFGPLDPRGAWFNMVTVPGSLPWAPDPVGRVVDMSPELLVHLALPVLALAIVRRRIFAREAPLLLPTLAFLCTLPPSLAAFFKFGGTLNSLQGFTLWAPAALLWAVGEASRRPALRRWAVTGAATAAIALVGLRCARMNTVPLRPVTAGYDQAAQMAAQLPGQVWFPWNPLVTVFSEGRFYHAEDGMCMRFLAGRALELGHARAGLPPRLSVVALPRGATHWGIALSPPLTPADAQVQDFGHWTLHSWAEPAAVPR